MICIACGRPCETTLNGHCSGCANNPFIVPSATITLAPIIVQPILSPPPAPPPSKTCPCCHSCICPEWCPTREHQSY